MKRKQPFQPRLIRLRTVFTNLEPLRILDLLRLLRADHVAFRAGEKLEWDAENLKAKNSTKAEEFLRREYRKGWSL